MSLKQIYDWDPKKGDYTAHARQMSEERDRLAKTRKREKLLYIFIALFLIAGFIFFILNFTKH
ncbi:hypothetical protein BH10BAC5_BH10BAC5_10170 [soil metagenome]